MKSEREVVIEQQVPPLYATYDGGDNEWDFNTGGGDNSVSGWENLSPGGAMGIFAGLLWKGEIDLAGLVAQEKTLFPAACAYQDANLFKWTLVSPPPGHAGIYVTHSIITDIPLTSADIDEMKNCISAPGFSRLEEDWEQVIFGQWRLWRTESTPVPDTTPPPVGPTWSNYMRAEPSIVQSGKYGSGSPTASQRLFCYRFIMLLQPITGPGNNGAIYIPAGRFIIAGATGKEGDLQHLMRLRRSWEVAS